MYCRTMVDADSIIGLKPIHAAVEVKKRFQGKMPAGIIITTTTMFVAINATVPYRPPFPSAIFQWRAAIMPAHKTSYALIYNRVGKWNSMVRAGQVFRYLAATPTAAFLTRLTKISTGHASPTAGAASAMLLILLIQVIGDGVRAVYKSNSAPDSLIDLRTGNAEVPLRCDGGRYHRSLRRHE